jgi:hypothetical protein
VVVVRPPSLSTRSLVCNDLCPHRPSVKSTIGCAQAGAASRQEAAPQTKYPRTRRQAFLPDVLFSFRE